MLNGSNHPSLLPSSLSWPSWHPFWLPEWQSWLLGGAVVGGPGRAGGGGAGGRARGGGRPRRG